MRKMYSTISTSSSTADYSCFTLPDPSFDTVDQRKTVNLTTAAINGLFAPFAVVSNILIVLVIARHVALHTPSTILLGSLAACDLLVGLVVQPCYVAFRLTETFHGSVPCGLRMLYSQSFWVCYGASFLTLSAISLERYVALRLHLRYKELVTPRRILKVIVTIWVVDITLTSLEWLKLTQNHSRYVQVALWLACFLLSCLAHVGIFVVLRRHQKQISATTQPQDAPRHRHQRQIKLAISVAYIVGIYCAFNIPVMVVQVYIQWKKGLTSYDITSWTETMAFLNSSINPIICCWRNRDIRREVLRAVVDGCPCVRRWCTWTVRFLAEEDQRRRSSCVVHMAEITAKAQ